MPLQSRRRLPTTTYSRKAVVGDRAHPYKRRCISIEASPLTIEDTSSDATIPLKPLSLPSSSSSSSPPPLAPFSVTRRTADPRRIPTKPRQTSKGPKLTQLTLDLGQRLRTTCRQCGMSYNLSDPADTAVHKRFHAKSTNGIDLPSSLIRPSHTLWAATATGDGGDDSTTAAVTLITARSSVAERRKAREVLQVVDSELSSATIAEAELWAGRYKVFLYSMGQQQRKVVGMLLAERIECAFVALGGDAGSVVLGAERSAVMGVSRVWTAGEWRRRGVARRLLDIACAGFVYGMTLQKGDVAFSQPTESGGKLARAWVAQEGVREANVNSDTTTTNAQQKDTQIEWLVYVEHQ